MALTFVAIMILGPFGPQPEIVAETSTGADQIREELKTDDAEQDDRPAVAAGKVRLAEAAPAKAPPKYTEDDFMWFDETASYKKEIVHMVNKIERQNDKCVKADTTSVSGSLSRSKPGDPVFYVTCDTETVPFNVFFRPGDADKSFAAIMPIGRATAVDACEAFARSAATHPSTVDFSRVLDLGYETYPNGRARVTSTFTAKNGFDLELKFRIDCLFEGATMLEANILEHFG